MYFQDVILSLQSFWARKGCLVVRPMTRRWAPEPFTTPPCPALGPEPWNTAMSAFRRPTTAARGKPNRLNTTISFRCC